MLPIPENHPLKTLFTGLVEHALQAELGLCAPALTDYLAEMLVAFTHVDEIRVARNASGRPVGEIADFINRWEVAGMSGQACDRFIHRRIGDYTLFWTGVYPEGVRRGAGPSWRDPVEEYIAFGKRSYAIASELQPPHDLPTPRLLRQLSEEFETCVCGLGIVRREFDQSGGGSGELVY